MNPICWKTVLMSLIANTSLTVVYLIVIWYMQVKELTGQDIVNMVGSVGLSYFGLNMLCFGAKWAAEILSSKIPGAKTNAPENGDKK